VLQLLSAPLGASAARHHTHANLAGQLQQAPKPQHYTLGGDAAQALDLHSFGAGPVAFITAHPDDVEGAAGGLVSLLAAQGTAVFYLILTNGNKGCSNPTICNATVTSSQIALWRSAEAATAAAVLGVPASNVMLFGYEDAMLTSYSESEVRMRLTGALRTLKPVATFSWAPYPNFNMPPSAGWGDLGFHADHMASGRFALDAHSNCGTDRLWPELGPAWVIPQMYMFDFGYGTVAPTHYVDISKAIVAKTNAFLAHKTQYPSPAWLSNFVQTTGMLVANATAVKPANVQYAEAYLAYF